MGRISRAQHRVSRFVCCDEGKNNGIPESNQQKNQQFGVNIYQTNCLGSMLSFLPLLFFILKEIKVVPRAFKMRCGIDSWSFRCGT